MLNHNKHPRVLDLMKQVTDIFQPHFNRPPVPNSPPHFEALIEDKKSSQLKIYATESGYKIRFVTSKMHDPTEYKLCATYDSSCSEITKAFFYGGKKSCDMVRNAFGMLASAKMMSVNQDEYGPLDPGPMAKKGHKHGHGAAHPARGKAKFELNSTKTFARSFKLKA